MSFDADLPTGLEPGRGAGAADRSGAVCSKPVLRRSDRDRPRLISTLRCVALGILMAAMLAGPAGAGELVIDLPGGPFETAWRKALRMARDYRSRDPGETIVIRLPPTIQLKKPLVLAAADSGQPGADLIIRGDAVAGTTISGDVALPGTPFRPEPGAPGPPFPDAEEGTIHVADLTKLWGRVSPPLAPRNALQSLPLPKLFLWDGDRRMSPARWPAIGYARRPAVSEVPGGLEVSVEGSDAPDLSREPHLWAAGFWSWNWWYQFGPASGTGRSTFRVGPPADGIGADIRFALVNVAGALDSPGRYFVDPDAWKLYYIPRADGTVPTVAAVDTLLTIRDARHIRIENVALRRSTGMAVLVERSEDIELSDCYAGQTGAEGIVVVGGRNVRIRDCVVDDTGLSGVVLIGGDRRTLDPGGHSIIGSRISRFGQELPTYQTGARIFGVGQTVASNEITEGPHVGIQFFGNDHVIQGNILHDLVKDSDDAGAIYAGRNWTSRGTRITSNYIYNVTNRIGSRKVRGVYLDDQISGIEVTGNVFEAVDEPVLIGGGRDNTVRANLFLTDHAVFVDARGTSWQSQMVEAGGALRRGLQDVPYDKPPYLDRYPTLATVLTDRPGQPVGNVLQDNVHRGSSLIEVDEPATLETLEDIGSIRLDGRGSFPGVIDVLPEGTPALNQLRSTRDAVMATRARMGHLHHLHRLPPAEGSP